MKTINYKIVLLNIATVIIMTVITVIFSLCYHISISGIIRNSVIIFMGGILLTSLFIRFSSEKRLLFNNNEKPFRFFGVFLLLYSIAAVFPLIPLTGWAFPLFFVILYYLSDDVLGIVSGTVILIFSCLISDAPLGLFSVFFMAGILSVMIFMVSDTKSEVAFSFIAFTFINFFEILINVVFYMTGSVKLEHIIVTLLYITVSISVLILITSHLRNSYVRKEELAYMEINDPTSFLLEELKHNNKAEYMRSIHCSYYAQLISAALGLDGYICKGGAYYCRLDLFDIEYKNIEAVMIKNNFPKELSDILMDILIEGGSSFECPEEFVIILCDDFINRLYQLKSENKLDKAHYEEVVIGILEEYYNDDRIDTLTLSFSDYNKIRSILLNENKYIAIINQ